MSKNNHSNKLLPGTKDQLSKWDMDPLNMIVWWLAYLNRNILDLILYHHAYDTTPIVRLALHRMLLNTIYNNTINTLYELKS